jgi:undecaprenyl-diphosphatase
MNVLTGTDTLLFHAVNGLPHPVLADTFAGTLSGLASWGLLWLFIAAVIILREEKRDHWFFLPLTTAIGWAWCLAELVVKPIFGRIRPVYASGTIVVPPVPSGYSFPSTHATIAFAAAYVIASRDRRLRLPMYLLAALVALSRVYLGHHYPSDVVVGAVLGLGIGKLALFVNARWGVSGTKTRRNR